MKKKVAFICVHNSCRSQMAEALTKHFGSDIFEVYSAGTESYPEVKPLAVEVIEELGISMASHYPKLLTDIPGELDILITMGCNVACPFVPSNHSEDWGLEDPSGGTIDDFRYTRELIRDKVFDLIKRVKEKAL